jgi:hypothetical protein
MNKQQIIAPLVVMGLIALIAALSLGRRHQREYLQMKAWGIGQDLAKETNSTAVVHLGASLSNVLAQLHGTPVTVNHVRLGDFGPTDDPAKVCVYLTNQSGTCIGIRLRPDSQSARFHILGYWTESGAILPAGVSP